jgi:hypothetical protein
MIRLNNTLFALLFFIFSSYYSNGQSDLFDFNHSLKFARYLSNSGQYEFASEEYERLRFLKPCDTTIIREQIVNYRLGNQCEKLQNIFDTLKSDKSFMQSDFFTHEYLRSALKCKLESDYYFEVSALLNTREKCFYELSYYWIHSRVQDAIRFNNKNKEVLSSDYPGLYKLTYDYESEKFKKPVIAAFMSALLPGSGKAYTGRWGDAIISFLFVGTNSWAAYRSFKKKGTESINGYIFGTLAVSFYSSNIWGSVKAAKKFNSNLNQRYQKNAENIIYHSY